MDRFRIFIFALVLLGSGCSTQKVYYPSGVPMLPGTTRLMNTAGFWLSRHPFPDRLLLMPGQVARLNQSIIDMKLVKDIPLFESPVTRENVRKGIMQIYDYLAKQKFYFEDFSPVTDAFFKDILVSCALDRVPAEEEVRFGFLNHFAALRSLPTNAFLTLVRGEFYFDELQMSGFDLATPLAVLHETRDGKWLFVKMALASGWVETDAVSFCSREQMSGYLSNPSFAVVTAAKADLYLDQGQTSHYDYARMGVRLVLGEAVRADLYRVSLPITGAGGEFPTPAYVRKRDMNEGYLPYTARNIVAQAFTLINTPYGWGDMFGEQDCSRFLSEIYATAGIVLPRNSAAQSAIGQVPARFTTETPEAEKTALLLDKGIPGISLLRMAGHIVLFLGFYEGKPYAIHETWSYWERVNNKDTPFIINRVVVSDLDLGKKSDRGSLLKRLLSITNPLVDEPAPE